MSENVLKLMVNDWKRRKNSRDGCVYDSKYADLYLQDDYGGRLKRCADKMEIESTDKILDIGCGLGLLYPFVKVKGANYTGVDGSQDMVKSAKEKYQDAKFITSIEGDKFNKVTMFDLVEHVGYYDLKALLDKAKTAMVKNGRLYIHTPNANYFMEKLKKWGVLPQIAGHIAVSDAWQLKVILEANGFTVKKIEHLPHYNPLLKWAHALSCLPFVGKYFKARIWMEAWA